MDSIHLESLKSLTSILMLKNSKWPHVNLAYWQPIFKDSRKFYRIDNEKTLKLFNKRVSDYGVILYSYYGTAGYKWYTLEANSHKLCVYQYVLSVNPDSSHPFVRDKVGIVTLHLIQRVIERAGANFFEAIYLAVISFIKEIVRINNDFLRSMQLLHGDEIEKQFESVDGGVLAALVIPAKLNEYMSDRTYCFKGLFILRSYFSPDMLKEFNRDLMESQYASSIDISKYIEHSDEVRDLVRSHGGSYSDATSRGTAFLKDMGANALENDIHKLKTNEEFKQDVLGIMSEGLYELAKIKDNVCI